MDNGDVQPQEHIAVLRCQTWHVWPHHFLSEDRSIFIEDGFGKPVRARLAVLAYDQRSLPERYTNEKTTKGFMLWTGEVLGLHHVRDTVLKAPNDRVPGELRHRNSEKGEVDICISFLHVGTVPKALIESVRTAAHAVAALLNLMLTDFLVPSMPFQLRSVLPGGEFRIQQDVTIAVHDRRVHSAVDAQSTVARVVSTLKTSKFGPKLSVALELYFAHFSETQTRVRFLLLVVALEALSSGTRKHEAAVTVMERWKAELADEMSKLEKSSEAWLSLDALGRELSFRAEDSIRSQFRKLFSGLCGDDPQERARLQRRALRVYDKRSTLVHDGHLPADELIELEDEARVLVETVLASAFSSV